MQQSSATQSLHLGVWGLRKIVAYSHSSSQCLLVSTVLGTASSLHPTSFLMIFTLVHCRTHSRVGWVKASLSVRRTATVTHGVRLTSGWLKEALTTVTRALATRRAGADLIPNPPRTDSVVTFTCYTVESLLTLV